MRGLYFYEWLFGTENVPGAFEKRTPGTRFSKLPITFQARELFFRAHFVS